MKGDAGPARVLMLVTNEVTHDSRVLREAGTLSRLGLDVSILGLDRRGCLPLIEERDGFRILRCREWRMGRWLRQRGNGFIAFWGKTLRGLRYLLFSLQARGNILHAHDLDTLPFALLTARRNRAKVVYDSHEIYTEQWPPETLSTSFRLLLRLLKGLESLLIRRVNATITVSESIAKELAARYVIPRPLVLRNCVSLPPEGEEGFSLRGSLDLGCSARVVVHTGSLVSFGRALRELILAFRHLGEEDHLVFLGEGPMAKELGDLARTEGLEGRVHFQRPVLPHQLIPTMREADLGAVMIRGKDSASYFLSLPNKLFETIAAGLPVVASDLPEIRRIVSGYEIGILCQPEDPRDIARAIEEALSPNRYAAFKANLKRAQEELNWERESQKLVDLYQRLIRDGRGERNAAVIQ